MNCANCNEPIYLYYESETCSGYRHRASGEVYCNNKNQAAKGSLTRDLYLRIKENEWLREQLDKLRVNNVELREALEILAVRRVGGGLPQPYICCFVCDGPGTKIDHRYMAPEQLIPLLKHLPVCLLVSTTEKPR